MKVLIVFESMFGNTETLARDVADGLAAAGARVAVADVRRVRPEDLRSCDLLVVGAPTHAFSLSRPNTRQDAVRQGAEASRAELGVREWLLGLGRFVDADGTRPATIAFDTRIEKARHLPGSAARRATRLLRAQGFPTVDRPASFYVIGVKGPVARGEHERARQWGVRLGSLVAERPARSA